MQNFRIFFIVPFFILFFTMTTSYAVTIDTKKDSITNNEFYYTININTPVVKDTQSDDKVNALIQKQIDIVTNQFKNNVSSIIKNVPTIPGLPKRNHDSNTLNINYKVFTNTDKILSIRFDMDDFYYGAAHPNIYFMIVNYDFSQDKQLSLDDIFKPHSDYLTQLSSYSKEILRQQLSKAASETVEPDINGYSPKPANYRIWNITPEGIVITFAPYQVAAYVFGPQEVLIPYSILNNVLNPELSYIYTPVT